MIKKEKGFGLGMIIYFWVSRKFTLKVLIAAPGLESGRENHFLVTGILESQMIREVKTVQSLVWSLQHRPELTVSI